MSNSTSPPWRRAGVYGAVAWLLGYLVVLVVSIVATGGSVGGATLLQEALTFFLATHLWPLLPGVSIPGTVGAVLYAPATALVVFTAGFKFVPAVGAGTAEEGFRVGALLTVGYAALTAIAVLVLALSTALTAAQLPTLAVAFGVTGIGFPVVFGGFGGWFAVTLLAD